MGRCESCGQLARRGRFGVGLLAGAVWMAAAGPSAAAVPAATADIRPTPQPLAVRSAVVSSQAAALASLKPPLSHQMVTSPFGWRDDPLREGRGFHNGVDYRAARGTEVHAAQEGTVTSIGTLRGFGHVIKIRHGAGVETLYAHLSRFSRGLHRGSRVLCGQAIGKVGSSGRSTGPHLHYEVLADGRRIDPEKAGYAPELRVAQADAGQGR